MLHIFWNICIFIITVGILITIHELGHFITARIFGVTIQRFSIGFGYTLLKYRDEKNTEYVISAIPLGGYVKMLNTHDKVKENSIQSLHAFEDKTILERILIISSGPIFNIIFAFLIYWFLFVIGIPTYRPIINNTIQNSPISQSGIPHNVEIHAINNTQTPDWESVRLALIKEINNKNKSITVYITPLHSSETKKYFINLTNWQYKINTQDIITSLGIIPQPTYTIKPILSKVQKNSSAMNAGLKIGDEIISINNKIINTWDIFVEEIKNNPNKTLEILIKRENKKLTLNIKPEKIIKNNIIEGFIGVSPTYLPISKEYTIIQQFGLIKAIQKSIEKIWKLISLTWNMLCKLIIGDIKLNNLGGPISIARSATEAAKHGFISYLTFLSLISINLGIMNLFPLPILDGGYLFLLVLESLSGEKISKKIEKYTYHIGIIILISLTCLAIFNDLTKIQYFFK